MPALRCSRNAGIAWRLGALERMALALSVALPPIPAHPLWPKAPPDKAMEFAKLDTLAGVVAITASTHATLFGSGRLFGILSWLIWSVWC
jgi:hypothetical protein